MQESELLKLAQIAEGELRFEDAEAFLLKALAESAVDELREFIYDRLFFIYSNPLNEDLERAEWCLVMKEDIRMSAENALQWTQFELFCRLAPEEAAKWADTAIVRAEHSDDVSALYSAASLRGFIAADSKDRITVWLVLRKLLPLIDKDVPFGDAIAFFEKARNLGDDIRETIERVSLHIAPRIEDPEFRARALQLSEPKPTLPA
ncbi:MAG: hypothetical protein WDN23_01330 [Edaphobacter sp.]